MKFGLFHTVQWPDGTDARDRFRESMKQAIHAEELGLYSVWFTEHHFARHGLTADNLGLLAYLAASTDRIRLGTAVSVLPFHHPLRLAESIATVDHLSDGRLDFGIGRGYQWAEYHGFGVDLSEGSELFNESLDLITRSWIAEAPFEHRGARWQFDDVNVLPRPLQQPYPPIWFATGSADGFRRCAEHDWNVMLPQGLSLAQITNMVTMYRTALDEAGKPYDPEKVVLARALYTTPNDQTAWDLADPLYDRFRENIARLTASPEALAANRDPFETGNYRDSALFGSPETCARMLRDLQAIGIEYVILFDHMAGLSHRQIVDSLDLFAAEVAPHFTARA